MRLIPPHSGRHRTAKRMRRPGLPLFNLMVSLIYYTMTNVHFQPQPERSSKPSIHPYRSRIIPLGGRNDPINEKGIQHYVKFVDDLLAAGITPL